MVQNEQSLRIAIQKGGRLSEKTLNLLENVGLEFDSYKNRILVPCRNYDVELLLIRDDDIPEYVQDGICELGFVGHNVTAEAKADVTALRGLGFGKCRLSVAVPKNNGIHSLKDLDGCRIATSYPVLTREHFARQGLSIKTIEISGAVEIAPTLNVADAITDIVSTGGTLKTNGLIELETILESEAQLICTNKAIPAHKQELIDKILMRIGARQQAEKSRYIMMNAPADKVDALCQIIPSLKSPTVLPLAENNMVAIHSVIPTGRFWEVMEELKDAGATGIVILPIENMIV
ncbi:ATP phosphoribosyltransferase [Balneolaceae bacterium ANBcel3]|nr:ATP phosphoribosyltransferase [Balneolaceae bacterium ANBcel3]